MVDIGTDGRNGLCDGGVFFDWDKVLKGGRDRRSYNFC